VRYVRQRQVTAWALSAPAILFMSLQVILLATAVTSAFTGAEGRFTTGHLSRVISDPLFLRGVKFNLVIPVVSVLIEACVGLGMALWLYHLKRGRVFWRVIVVLPFALPEIVYLLTMKLLLRDHGYLNSILVSLSPGMSPIGWLEPGSWLMTAVVILVDAWRVTPFVFLLVLAALEQMPESYVEAARVDGGSWVDIIRYIQIPLVIPALVVAVALRSIDAFRIFTAPFVLVGVDAMPVLSSVAYHYRADLHDAAGGNVAALLLAVGLALLVAAAFILHRRLRWR